MAAGRVASVVAVAPVGITAYDADGDTPSLSSWGGNVGRDDDDGERKGGRGDGEATARQRRGDGEATVRRWQGDYKATVAAGGRGNEAIDNSITNNIFITNNGTLYFASFPHDTKVPVQRMRWPSGPDANKTRPHLGLFLHIKP